jgi:hypothetical protein
VRKIWSKFIEDSLIKIPVLRDLDTVIILKCFLENKDFEGVDSSAGR